MHFNTLKSLSAALEKKELSSVELCRHFFDRMKRFQSQGIFTHVNEGLSLEKASEADMARSSGKSTALTGVPVAHKDIFCTRDMPSSCASKILAGYRSPFNA